MKWFDRWFYKKARWAWKRAGYQYPEWRLEQDLLDRRAEELYRDDKAIESIALCEDVAPDNDGMRIDIKHIIGGHVVTVRHDRRDNQKQHNHTGYQEPSRSSYIITDEQDFDLELCKILAMERLKR